MPNKPHLKMRYGQWYVTTGPDKYAPSVACGDTPFKAYMAYLQWQLIFAHESSSAVARAARGGKFNMALIFTAWQRLRGKSGKA